MNVVRNDALRWGLLLAACAVWFAGGAVPIAAQEGAGPVRYRLAPGDRISLIVLGQPDFSGEMSLDESGSIALPLLGRVSISGLTLADAEKSLTEHLSQGYLERPAVTLRLQEYRPVYVLGMVRSPGSYPYRPGLTVASALALAGGFGAADQPAAAARTDFLAAHERLATLERNQRQLLVRRARLEAQRDDRATFQTGLAQTDEADREIHAQESELLSTQRQAQAERLVLLRAQKPRLEAEIEGVRAQSASEKRQLELIQMHLKDYNELMSSGLARRYTGIELQREEARNKGNIARLSAELARLDLAIGEVSLRINEAAEAYQRRVMTELAEVRQRLQELDLTVPIAREFRQAKLHSGGEVTLDDPAHRILVTRSTPSGRSTIDLESDAVLQPGDIVEIVRKSPQGAGRALSSLRGPSASETAVR